MDYVRKSIFSSDIMAQDYSDMATRAPEPPVKVDSESDRFPFDDVMQTQQACISRCLQILPFLLDKKFNSKYWTLPVGMPDCYVFSHRSSRCLVLEVVTRFSDTETENLYTYKFRAHPLFEDKLNTYTRWKSGEKPNQSMVRSRTWDVALNVVMKIEALPEPYTKHRFLLKREYEIMEFLWNRYLQSGSDIDEMTGIPMVFEYCSVPNDMFNVTPSSTEVDEIDKYGRLKLIDFPIDSRSQSTLAYMTMEKLGPNVGYLQRLTRSTRTPPFTFDLWTSLKIFDQLLCRILQVHKLGVVHNDVCPENIYMGNGVGFNVVYLSNYKRGYIVTEGDKVGPIGLAGSSIGCNVRFQSVGQMTGSGYGMKPLDDVESAFYVLLAMLSSDILPWDKLLQAKRTSEYSFSSLNVGQNNKMSDLLDDLQVQVAPSRIPNETLRSVMEFKKRFWQSERIVNHIVANCHCLFSGDTKQAASIATLISEMYLRVRDWRLNFKNRHDCFEYCRNLSRSSSEEFRQFMELRRCALIYFEFAEAFDIINDLTFRKRAALEKSTQSQQPWNSFVWCFNSIEIRTDMRKA